MSKRKPKRPPPERNYTARCWVFFPEHCEQQVVDLRAAVRDTAEISYVVSRALRAHPGNVEAIAFDPLVEVEVQPDDTQQSTQ